jgi:hypothetical protein
LDCFDSMRKNAKNNDKCLNLNVGHVNLTKLKHTVYKLNDFVRDFNDMDLDKITRQKKDSPPKTDYPNNLLLYDL